MKILTTICARGGSKGIPGKNIKTLNGKPLLYYTLEFAKKFYETNEGKIQLSTDSDEILKVARGLGYLTNYRRPEYLAGDTSGKIEVIREAWRYAEKTFSETYDLVIDLDVTSPLRTLADVNGAIEMLNCKQDALNIFSVSHAARNPYFNMVELGENGFYNTVKLISEIKSRQEAPKIYDMNASFYIYTRAFLTGNFNSAITGRSLAYVMPHPCFDLDEPLDFQIMDLLLKEKILNIEI